MVTVDEIRARVEAADRARIAKRADAAARVADSVRRRDELVAALAEQEAVVAGALSDARAVLTDDELIAFTGLSRTDLPVPAIRKSSRRGGRKSAARPRSTTPPAPPSAVAEEAQSEPSPAPAQVPATVGG